MRDDQIEDLGRGCAVILMLATLALVAFVVWHFVVKFW